MEADRNEQGLSLALLQFHPSSVVLLDTEGRIRSLNRNAERLLSTTDADAVGKSYTDVFGESLSQRIFKLILKGGAEGEARAIEATLPGGRRAKLRATAGPLKDARGTLSGIVFVADEDTSLPKLEALPDNEVRLRDALRRYLGDNVAEMVDARPSFIDVGGQTQTVSVLHADVRGYTAMAEALPPDRVVALLMRPRQHDAGTDTSRRHVARWWYRALQRGGPRRGAGGQHRSRPRRPHRLRRSRSGRVLHPRTCGAWRGYDRDVHAELHRITLRPRELVPSGDLGVLRLCVADAAGQDRK